MVCVQHRCDRKFVDRPGFEGLHYSGKVILSAPGRVAEGRLQAGAARGVNTDMGTKVSGRTVQRWVKMFSSMVDAFTSNLKLPHGVGAMSIDEKHFKSNGDGRYLFEIMSIRTRYVMCHDTAKDKLNYDATRLLQTAVDRAGMPPVFVSDKLKGFKTAHRSVTCTGSTPQTLHKSLCVIKNNLMYIIMINMRYSTYNGNFGTRAAYKYLVEYTTSSLCDGVNGYIL